MPCIDYDPSLDTLYCAELSQVGEVLSQFVAESDVILVFGAGDVNTIIATLPGGLT